MRLYDLFKRCNEDDNIRVVVLTGRGDKAFSAGADLKRLIPLMTKARGPDDVWDEKLVANMSMMNNSILR